MNILGGAAPGGAGRTPDQRSGGRWPHGRAGRRPAGGRRPADGPGGAPHRRPAPRLAALLAALALTAAACSGGSDGNSQVAPSATPVNAAPAATASAAPTAPALKAENYVLTEGPLTDGFVASPPSSDSSSGGGNTDDLALKNVAACLGVPREQFRDEHEDQADGPEFTSVTNELVTISSSAQIVSEEKLASDLEILYHPRFAECFGQELEKELAAEADDGLAIEIVAVESPAPPAGANALLRISMGISAEGVTIGVVMDHMFFFQGRVEMFVVYTNVENIPPPNHMQRIADHLSGKIQVQ